MTPRELAQVEAECTAIEMHAFLDPQIELILSFGLEEYMADQDTNPIQL